MRKQFIAGARCPSCNAEDRIRLCRDEGREWIECVTCGYASEAPPPPEHPQAEAAAPDAVGVVRLLGESLRKP